jgi:hypothetical protein
VGYFLDKVLAEAHTDEQSSVVRRLFVEHVRARGPLPALRIGRQPTACFRHRLWTGGRQMTAMPVRTALLALLRVLGERWRAALSRVPRIGRTTAVSEPGADDPSPWILERMEHACALGAPTGDTETVLVGREYTDGALDWHAFDEAPGMSLGVAPTQSPPEVIVQIVIPAPVSYQGMLATRWFEFEDAVVDFGSVEVAPPTWRDC